LNRQTDPSVTPSFISPLSRGTRKTHITGQRHAYAAARRRKQLTGFRARQRVAVQTVTGTIAIQPALAAAAHPDKNSTRRSDLRYRRRKR
jgi:hypothetical protein